MWPGDVLKGTELHTRVAGSRTLPQFNFENRIKNLESFLHVVYKVANPKFSHLFITALQVCLSSVQSEKVLIIDC